MSEIFLNTLFNILRINKWRLYTLYRDFVLLILSNNMDNYVTRALILSTQFKCSFEYRFNFNLFRNLLGQVLRVPWLDIYHTEEFFTIGLHNGGSQIDEWKKLDCLQ